jgi:hypothetical protein
MMSGFLIYEIVYFRFRSWQNEQRISGSRSSGGSANIIFSNGSRLPQFVQVSNSSSLLLWLKKIMIIDTQEIR